MFASVRNFLVRGVFRNINQTRSAYQKVTVNNYVTRKVVTPQTVLLPTLYSGNSTSLALRILPECKIELPSNRKTENAMELPNYSGTFPNLIDKLDPTALLEIKEPVSERNIEKQAARLIVIRRRKMKKHKLRKLRIRMKFEWAKIRQRRELKKEKAFQAVLISQIKEAEAFDATEYVREKLRKVNMIESDNSENNNGKPFSRVVSK